MPLGRVEIPIQATATFRIYVCGAVEQEGYVEVAAGSAYGEVIRRAGILPVSVIPSYAATTVNGSVKQVVVNYHDGQEERECINVNSALIAGRLPIDGISEEIVNKLADYLEQHGKISNRQQLAVALGDGYYHNFYKFFVAEEDYEESN